MEKYSRTHKTFKRDAFFTDSTLIFPVAEKSLWSKSVGRNVIGGGQAIIYKGRGIIVSCKRAKRKNVAIICLNISLSDWTTDIPYGHPPHLQRDPWLPGGGDGTTELTLSAQPHHPVQKPAEKGSSACQGWPGSYRLKVSTFHLLSHSP